MKRVTLTVFAIAALLILTGCEAVYNDTSSNLITGNAVADTDAKEVPKGLDLKPSEEVQVCGSYSENLKKIGECLGDLERGNDGNYYCKGTCGFDYTCFRDKRVVPCPTE
ncbi:MAG: hypothetical protein Q8R00_00735 [Candidatus Nanoarchaeia archaeon]|nr:hypothetical protein [Candidatus Nanoarchaeia archaeon]